jgi:flagellar M-ring protein FliF
MVLGQSTAGAAMSDFFKQLISQLTAIWHKLSVQQKVITATLVIFTVFGLVGLLVWAQDNGRKSSDSSYKVLYSDLELEDAGAITEQLQKSNYQYKLDNGGRTVLVPSKQLYEARIALAREGLPKSHGLGYELFDKTNFGMTDFVQKINARRAMEGELQRTIEGLEEVKGARVHIVIPEASVFLEQQKDSKASVVVLCKPGRQLSKDQIRGIGYLVSSSVDGLKPENVSILDCDGKLLTSPFADDETALLGSHNIELQQNVEHYLENKATQMLSGILGPSKAYVKVSAELDFNRVDKTMEQYNPESRVVRSEERTDENVKNAPDGDNQKERSLTNYEIDKTVQHVIQETGNVKRLTVSVAVDGKYRKGDKGTTVYVARSAEEVSSIEDIIKNAVGYDLTRGDQITVSQLQFDNEFLRQEQEDFQKNEQWQFRLTVIKYAIGALIVILLLLFLRWAAKTVVEAMNPPLPVLEPIALPPPSEDQPDELPEEVRKALGLVDRLEGMIIEEPANISAIIRHWISEPQVGKKKKKKNGK